MEAVEARPSARRAIRRRHFGQIYRRGGIWYVRIRRAGLDVVEAVGPDRSLAEARRSAVHDAYMRERALGVREVARCTWDELWKRLEPWLRANHAETTFAAEIGRAKKTKDYFGSKALMDVTKADVEAFLAKLRNDERYTPAAMNRYLAFLRVAFRRAVEEGFARTNPCEGIRGAREQARPVPYLDAADLERIFACAPRDARDFFVLDAETGGRRGEILALDWRDVDLRAGAITVRRSKNHEDRRIPLTSRSLEVLRRLRAEAPPMSQVGPCYVFPSLAGLVPSCVSKRFAIAVRRAGFSGIRLHDLRHAYASTLARAGVAPGVIGTLLGDKTPSVVFRYSRHAPKNAEEEAVARLVAERALAIERAAKEAKNSVA